MHYLSNQQTVIYGARYNQLKFFQFQIITRERRNGEHLGNNRTIQKTTHFFPDHKHYLLLVNTYTCHSFYSSPGCSIITVGTLTIRGVGEIINSHDKKLLRCHGDKKSWTGLKFSICPGKAKWRMHTFKNNFHVNNRMLIYK